MAYPFYGNPYGGYQMPQQPTYQAGIIWAEGGLQEASAYPIAPNTAIPIWDRHANTIYFKQSDAAGRQTIRILDYTERTGDNQAAAPVPATKDDVTGLVERLERIEAALKGGAAHE